MGKYNPISKIPYIKYFTRNTIFRLENKSERDKSYPEQFDYVHTFLAEVFAETRIEHPTAIEVVDVLGFQKDKVFSFELLDKKGTVVRQTIFHIHTLPPLAMTCTFDFERKDVYIAPSRIGNIEIIV